jgi:hypothetical protein
MKILRLSPRKRNFDTDPVYPQLDQALRRLGNSVSLLTEEDYLSPRIPVSVQKIAGAGLMRRRALQAAREADVVEAAGDLGWSLFSALHSGSRRVRRPLLVTGLPGLECLDQKQLRALREPPAA